MVAVRQFVEHEVLEDIMVTFWRHGYLATSIDDLAAATGLKRGSLYAAFGDKKAMFLRAYALYEATYEAPLLTTLSDGGLNTALNRFYSHVLTALADDAQPPGCLIAQIMSESTGRGDDIEAAAQATLNRSVAAFKALLVRAQQTGELAANADTEILAWSLASTNRSMAMIYRLTKDLNMARGIADAAMQKLPLQTP